jgi:hydrogenase maturation protease
MHQPRILIAGVGNIFLGDDAFGVEVVQRLARRPLAEQMRVVDFGIRSLDLTYALLDGYDVVVLVDATPRGGPPGTVYVLEPDVGPQEGPAAVDPHSMDPAKVLRLAAAMGARVGRLLVVGCEPSPVDDVEEMRDGLSEPVRAAVDEAVRVVESLVSKLLGGGGAAGPAGLCEENTAAVREGHPCP